MKFQQHYSSSKANLYEVTANSGERLLIECGCTWNKLQKKLDYNLKDIKGCLISHEHKDHCKSFKDIKKAGIKIFASEGTLRELGLLKPFHTENGKMGEHLRRKAGILHPDLRSTTHHIPPFQVLSFDTVHDASQPLGFVVYVDGEYLLFATDTKYIRQRFVYPFSIIAIECSYDKDILQGMVDTGSIEESVATRLLNSHQEKSVCKKYLLEFCDLSRCRETHLLHMSRGNIDKKQTAKEFKDELFVKVVTV